MRSAWKENKVWNEIKGMEAGRGVGPRYSIFKIDWLWKLSTWKYLKTYFEVSKEASPVANMERGFQGEETANAKALWQKYVVGVQGTSVTPKGLENCEWGKEWVEIGPESRRPDIIGTFRPLRYFTFYWS